MMFKLFQEQFRTRFSGANRPLITLTLVWLVSMLVLGLMNAEKEMLLIWGLMVPFGILFYWICFHILLPSSRTKRLLFLNFMLKAAAFLFVMAFPVGILTFAITRNEDASVSFAGMNFFIQLTFTAPLAFILFKRHLRGKEELHSLQQKLGHSAANIDFLRSQINPHFLFNALNTIYGLSLQEQATRTSEAVEKLGDMMRFMLHENTQEKIALTREIDYLNNFISLQRLRTEQNPQLKIETHIEQPLTTVSIAPMLLIPFVENAFKHGISLREPSVINVTLEMKGNTLYFDVHNSKHTRPDMDPERYKSGIGLNNVRQRLQLVYPQKHELIIRETAKDFFVHLTIALQNAKN